MSTQAATSVLSLRSVTAGYGASTVVNGIDLTVERGQVVALLGANGVGKTTLLRVVAGLVAPRSGEITFMGANVARTHAHRMARRGLGHVPEGRGIFPGLTVRENLSLSGFSGPGRRAAPVTREEIDKLFPVLASRLDQRGGTLSGGEQQMLAVARALLMRPSLLLLDEPSLGMAPLVVEGLFRALARVKAAGVSMLIAEQAAQQALGIADFVYVLGSGGRVVASGTAQEMAKSSVIYESYMT
jgi:branched-chain amino acid transport system ATP-binding protein